ncbi:MAG: esterase-like activity of phytase family protein [Alphaproteobacteria bacterium]|jgi:hypothetical protein
MIAFDPIRPNRRAFAFGLLAASAAGSGALAKPNVPETPIDIVVRSFPINSFKARDSNTTFGSFEFRGGLELQSDSKNFGGLSSLRVDPTGARLVAVTDNGQWLTARLDMEGSKPSGLSEVRMSAILGPQGRPIADTGDWDAESLWIEGGTAFVGVERTHRIFRFDAFGREGIRARGIPTPVPMGSQRLPSNRGIEALGIAPRGTSLAGAMIAISERGQNAAGDIRGFLIGGPRPGEFFVKRTNDFDVTDLAFLPNGDMLLLERWFSAWRGVAMRIRRIDLATMRPGATVDGPIVLSADLSAQIDNMEGIAVHRNAAGETIVTLISDDNFSFLQRNLLLQFAWTG